ncbi:TetR/AcrR family transcriptional regulator [Streptomycetaceae bacterium NBC_01309]
MSMQAVADRLGVPRGTLYHHVADREEMIALVAVARLEQALDETWMPAPDADWRAWLAAFGRVMRDALIAHGTPVDSVLLEGAAGRRQLTQIERILDVMVRDGFTPAHAMQALAVVADVAAANARTVLALRAHGDAPHRAFLAAAREGADGPLRLLLAGALEHADPDSQFAVSLAVAVAGIAAVLGPDSQTPTDLPPPAGCVGVR